MQETGAFYVGPGAHSLAQALLSGRRNKEHLVSHALNSNMWQVFVLCKKFQAEKALPEGSTTLYQVNIMYMQGQIQTL